MPSYFLPHVFLTSVCVGQKQETVFRETSSAWYAKRVFSVSGKKFRITANYYSRIGSHDTKLATYMEPFWPPEAENVLPDMCAERPCLFAVSLCAGGCTNENAKQLRNKLVSCFVFSDVRVRSALQLYHASCLWFWSSALRFVPTVIFTKVFLIKT